MTLPRRLTIVLATNNQDKVREIRAALADLPVDIKTKADFDSFPDPEETGDTLEANARIKAMAIFEAFNLPALSDDSGLEVDALGGAPGVYSSRYAGEDVTYEDNYRKLLSEMIGVPKAKRIARFRSVIALCWSADEIEYVEGVCEGFITEDVAGTGGFGYDPVFYYPPLNKRFSELSVEEKNQVSHRGLALKRAKDAIRRRLDQAKR